MWCSGRASGYQQKNPGFASRNSILPRGTINHISVISLWIFTWLSPNCWELYAFSFNTCHFLFLLWKKCYIRVSDISFFFSTWTCCLWALVRAQRAALSVQYSLKAKIRAFGPVNFCVWIYCFMNLWEYLWWRYKLSTLSMSVLKVDIIVNMSHACIEIGEFFPSAPMVKYQYAWS